MGSQREMVMKKMKRSAQGVRSTFTLGDLVTLAYDVSPNRATAVKLVGLVLGGRGIHFGRHTNSGR